MVGGRGLGGVSDHDHRGGGGQRGGQGEAGVSSSEIGSKSAREISLHSVSKMEGQVPKLPINHTLCG